MWQELTGGWPRASQGLDVMAMDPLRQGYDRRPKLSRDTSLSEI